jgi:hypothetical protein
VLKAPELWRGGLKAKANFGSAAQLLTEVDDLAILLLAGGDISQDEPVAQYDGSGQSDKATVSTKHDSTRRVYEWSFVARLASHDHRQLRKHSLVSTRTCAYARRGQTVRILLSKPNSVWLDIFFPAQVGEAFR